MSRFRRSRRIAPCRERALGARDHRAVRRPEAGDRGRPRRRRRPRPIADRLGQDARLRRPDGRPDRGRRAPRPRPSCSLPTRELATQIVDELRTVAQPAACRSPPSTAASGSRQQAKRAAQAHIVVATPGRLEDLLDRGAFTLEQRPGPRPRRGRPHARHGLQARRRPDRRQDAARPPDALLLGDARGAAGKLAARLHAATRAATSTSRRRDRRRGRAPLRPPRP